MSPKRLEYHAGAVADVKDAIGWYRQRSPKAVLDFIEELNRAADTIREAPDRWPLGKNGTRRFLLWRFPFAVIYSEQETAITVWAVAMEADGQVTGQVVAESIQPSTQELAGLQGVGRIVLGF